MEKKQPAHKGKVGRVRFSIWENQTKNGTLYTVNIDRVYVRKNGKGAQEFRNTSSFTRDDLELVKIIADKAQAFIDQQSS